MAWVFIPYVKKHGVLTLVTAGEEVKESRKQKGKGLQQLLLWYIIQVSLREHTPTIASSWVTHVRVAADFAL